MGIQYDPVKRSLGRVFNATPFLRVMFYKLLDLLLLRAWYINRELKKLSKSNPEAIVVDAGSGFGQYVYRMVTTGKKWQVKGLEIKQEQVDDCNQFFGRLGLGARVKFEYADLTEYCEENTFDLALSVDVMEHILEDEKVFKNINRALKPGGMMLISTPSDLGGSDVHDHDHESFIDEHVRDGYNIQEIEAKLKRAGFAQVEAAYSYGTAGSLSWKLSMKYPLLMVNTSKLLFVVLPFYYVLFYPICFVLNFVDLYSHNTEGTGLIVKAWKAKA